MCRQQFRLSTTFQHESKPNAIAHSAHSVTSIAPTVSRANYRCMVEAKIHPYPPIGLGWRKVNAIISWNQLQPNQFL